MKGLSRYLLKHPTLQLLVFVVPLAGLVYTLLKDQRAAAAQARYQRVAGMHSGR